MEKVKIQCPRCTKSYQVNSSELNIGLNKYNCTMCLGSFKFNYSPNMTQKIKTYLIREANQGPIELKVNSSSSSAKTGAVNLSGIRPLIVRKWKALLDDFENEQMHLDFIETCRKFDSIKFAVFKYEELNIEAGGDPICQMKLAQLNNIQQNLFQESPKNLSSYHSWLDKRYYTWQRVAWMAPFVLSFILILVGFMSLSFRNLVGVGVALGVFSVGLMLMLKGKISFN